MRRMSTVLAAAFVVAAFGTATFAQAPAAVEKAPIAKSATTQTAKTAKTMAKDVKKASASVATGKVASYDVATKNLTVTTKSGDKSFTLTPDTKIVAGAKAGKEDELVAGKNVKVAYTEAGGQMTASKVTIAAAPKAAKKATEKMEKK